MWSSWGCLEMFANRLNECSEPLSSSCNIHPRLDGGKSDWLTITVTHVPLFHVKYIRLLNMRVLLYVSCHGCYSFCLSNINSMQGMPNFEINVNLLVVIMQEFVIGFCAIVLATFTTGVDSKSFVVRTSTPTSPYFST